MNKRIAILGGGNGAHTMAADLSMRGFSVRMYEDPAFINNLKVLQDTLTIHSSGEINGSAKIDFLTDNIADAIEGVKYIAIVTQSNAHKYIAEKLKNVIKKDQVLIIYPGGFGALRFKAVLGENCPVIVQTDNLPYSTRMKGEATVYCSGRNSINVAVFPASAEKMILEEVMEISPYNKVYEDVLECDLSLINPAVHCGPCVINIGHIEQQSVRGDYYLYEHFTVGAAKIDFEIDRERKAIGEALGYRINSLEAFIGTNDDITWKHIYQKMHGGPDLTPLKGPDSMWHRYFTEDCPNGLVPWSELGKLCGIQTPTIDSIINLYNLVHEKDWRKDGININEMGLSGMDIEQIKKLVKEA